MSATSNLEDLVLRLNFASRGDGAYHVNVAGRKYQLSYNGTVVETGSRHTISIAITRRLAEAYLEIEEDRKESQE